MVNITLAISEELKEELQKHDEVNWSAVIRKALHEHLKRIEMIEAIAQKSKLTQRDANELAKKIKREMARRHGLVKD
jgi:Arc/MetJ-type ribon-helix-helix transcriptional regulator